MGTTENLETLQKAAADYFNAAYKLNSELSVGDTPSLPTTLEADLAKVRDVALAAELDLSEARVKARLQATINFQFRRRNYIVRRKAAVAGTELTWTELRDLSTDGPWHAGQMGDLEMCRRHRDRQNAQETRDRPDVRGWKPGTHVWEIWGYDPTDDSWSKLD